MIRRILPLVTLALLSVAACAQTYTATNVPFVCDAATASRVPLAWGGFECRGVFFNNSSVELFFWGTGRIQFYTPAWSIGPYNSSLALTSFTQPNPPYCDKLNQNCAGGFTEGTFAYTWSGTDANGVVHSGSAAGTWHNKQICGGERCWYHPIVDSLSFTVNN